MDNYVSINIDLGIFWAADGHGLEVGVMKGNAERSVGLNPK